MSTKFWYNGTGMDFYASVSGGKVSNLSPVLTNDYGQYTLPNFKATNGDWYGKTSFNRKEYGYCQIGFINQGTTFITIDSLTGIEN